MTPARTLEGRLLPLLCFLTLLALQAGTGGRAASVAAQPAPDPTDEEEQPQAETPEPEFADAVAVDDGLSASLQDGRDIVLHLRLDGSEDYSSLARRTAGDPLQAAALQRANAGAAPAAGRTLVVPWSLAREEYRYLALRAIFPADRFEGGAWEHRPGRGRLAAPGEGLWQIALWFTGDGQRWQELARVNGLSGPSPPGDRRPVRVPVSMLLPLFRPVTEGPVGLRYGSDEQGPFAEAALERGAALYSGIVIRFTDLTRPDDVNAAADLIRRRSRIADVRRMEVGRKVRIPVDLLATRFLPENDPRRVLARLHESEVAGLAPPTRAIALEGVHVLLDPGHGGDDVGAKHGRVWESDYVYDIACRIERLLEKETAAKVDVLVRDTRYGCRVFDSRRLPRNRQQVIATQPPHKIVRGSTGVAVNLRWYLANAKFRELTGRGDVPPEKVVFISLHADSLHSAMRGSTLYIPGERFRRAAQAERSAVYDRYREWRESPEVVVSRAERLRDEATSRQLAVALLAGLREQHIPIHEDQPIRDHVTRGRHSPRAWLPAVLRGNVVPAKVLLETVNLGNAEDARTLEDPAGRAQIARGVLSGLLRYYSGERPLVAAGGSDGSR